MNNVLRKAFFGIFFFVAFGVLLSVVAPARVLAADSTASQKDPWYSNTSTIISVTALAFSFGTTFVSYRRTEKQDIQASRQELRGILQRLSAIPRENLEAAKRNTGDPAAIQGISQLYNQESTMLTRQAAEIVRRLPKGVVSGTEYYAIGNAFQSAYNLSAAKEFLKKAMDVANNFNDEIGAIRSSANLDFIAGQPEEGRVLYQQALGIFTKYPDYDPYTVASTHIFTEIFWGYAEGNIGQFQLAGQHIDNAQRIVEKLPPSMGSDGLRAQIQQARDQLARAVSTGMVAGAPTAPGPSWMPHPAGN
jgi:hypothetical protein